jgi:lysophospholipase L1-like esterase
MEFDMERSDLKIWSMLDRGEFIRVVAFGASNTQRYLPGTHWFDYVEMGFKGKYFGGCGHFVNSGISGDTTEGLLRRFDRELAFYKPNLVIMTIGGNDCNPAKNISAEKFRSNLTLLCNKIRGLGSDVLLQTYYACDLELITPAERADLMVEYMQIVREVAEAENVMLNDNDLRWARLRDSDIDTYRLLMLNSMHVNDLGNQVIGLDLMRKLGLPLKENYRSQCAPGLMAQALLDRCEA